jgi:hypothetical protein
MTAAWAAAAMLDALRAELDRVLKDEHADRQLIAERTAAKLATVAAAFHAAADQADDGEDVEPYCATCGQWIGVFFGLDGWRHFRGDPAPGGQRELYDPGHPVMPAWCVPPGRALSPAQGYIIGKALADAIVYRADHRRCAGRGQDQARDCPDHVVDTSQVRAYRQLAAELARALPGITGEER